MSVGFRPEYKIQTSLEKETGGPRRLQIHQIQAPESTGKNWRASEAGKPSNPSPGIY